MTTLKQAQEQANKLMAIKKSAPRHRPPVLVKTVATPSGSQPDSVVHYRLVGRRFFRPADGAEARVMAEVEGYVVARYKGASPWLQLRADFLLSHVERRQATPNDSR